MLYIVLVISGILLVVANLIVFRAREPVGKTASLCLAVALGPFFVSCVLPMVAFQGLLLALSVIVWKNSGRGPSYFLRLSCVATLIAFVMAGWLVWKSESEAARLRSLYPYESMEARLPEPRRDPNQNSLTAAAVARLGRVEDEIREIAPCSAICNWRGCTTTRSSGSSTAPDLVFPVCREGPTNGCSLRRSVKSRHLSNRARAWLRPGRPASTKGRRPATNTCWGRYMKTASGTLSLPRASATPRTAGTWRGSYRTGFVRCPGRLLTRQNRTRRPGRPGAP